MPGIIGFIQIPGIRGMATDANHQGWVEISSVSQGANRNIDPQQNFDLWAAQSKVEVGAVVVQKVADASSPLLVAANCEGKQFKDVTIDLVRQGKNGYEVYYQWKLANVFIAAYDIRCHQDEKGIISNLETLHLRAGQINWSYRPATDKGAGAPVEAGWSIANSRRIA